MSFCLEFIVTHRPRHRPHHWMSIGVERCLSQDAAHLLRSGVKLVVCTETACAALKESLLKLETQSLAHLSVGLSSESHM